MSPFVAYPHEGRILLGKPRNIGSTRYGQGLELQRLTGQSKCVYCGMSFIDDYYHWLLMSVDHVVPRGEAKRLSVPMDYYEDMINLVLGCAGCNGFQNRFALLYQMQPQWSLEEFVTLRDVYLAAQCGLMHTFDGLLYPHSVDSGRPRYAPVWRDISVAARGLSCVCPLPRFCPISRGCASRT